MLRLCKAKRRTLTPDLVLAITAAQESGQRLRATQAKRPEVEAMAQRLATMRQRNHFAEMIRSAIIGG